MRGKYAHGPVPWLTRMQRGCSERTHNRLVLHDDWLGRHASTNSVACQGEVPRSLPAPAGGFRDHAHHPGEPTRRC